MIDRRHEPDPALVWSGDDGALVDVDGVSFAPFPMTDAQLEVLRNVDRSWQVDAEWPDDGPRTRTAAALISHLLAQGKRVLMTARSDGALAGIRDELPDAMKSLSVAVVNAGSDYNIEELASAIEQIAESVRDFDPDASDVEIRGRLQAIDLLGQERSSALSLLDEARLDELRTQQLPLRKGTLAAIASVYEELRPTYGWIVDFVHVAPDSEVPLSNAQIVELRNLDRHRSPTDDEVESRKELIAPSSLMEPDAFADLVRAELDLREQIQQGFDDAYGQPYVHGLSRVSGDVLGQFRASFMWAWNEITALSQEPVRWSAPILLDVLQNGATPWQERRDRMAELIGSIASSDLALGVEVQEGADLPVVGKHGDVAPLPT